MQHLQGDNDPVDVVEIGSAQLQTGGVYRVKALGAYAMVDDGELDWKILCIRVDDPLTPVLNDIEDIERYGNLMLLVGRIVSQFLSPKPFQGDARRVGAHHGMVQVGLELHLL